MGISIHVHHMRLTILILGADLTNGMATKHAIVDGDSDPRFSLAQRAPFRSLAPLLGPRKWEIYSYSQDMSVLNLPWP